MCFLTFIFYFSGSFLETVWSLDGAESMEDWFMSSVRYFLTTTGGIFFEGRARSKICEKKPVLGYENLHVVWGRGGIYLLFFSAYVHSIILRVFSEGERIFDLFEGKSQGSSHVSPRNQGFILSEIPLGRLDMCLEGSCVLSSLCGPERPRCSLGGRTLTLRTIGPCVWGFHESVQTSFIRLHQNSLYRDYRRM